MGCALGWDTTPRLPAVPVSDSCVNLRLFGACVRVSNPGCMGVCSGDLGHTPRLRGGLPIASAKRLRKTRENPPIGHLLVLLPDC